MIVQNAITEIIADREFGNTLIHGYQGVIHPNNLLHSLTSHRLDQHHIEGPEGELLPPWACSFSKEHQNLVAVADEAGGLLVLDTDKTGPLSVKQDFLAHKNAVCDIAWSGQHLVTASGDTTVALWDIEQETRLRTFRGHTSSVKAVTVCQQDQAMLATGSMDGHILIWDQRIKRKGDESSYMCAIKNAHIIPGSSKVVKKRKPNPSLDSRQSVTAVLFQDEHTLVSSGSSDGAVKVWDLRKISKLNPVPCHTFSYGGGNARSRGFTSLVLDSTRTRLFASCVDHSVYMYDCAAFTTSPVSCFKGHRVSSFYVKLALSPDDQYLLSGSSNHDAYMWQVRSPRESPLLLRGHSAEVSTVAWSGYLDRLVTASDDCSLMVWRLPAGRELERVDAIGETVGRAEPMSREIGTSVRASPRKNLNGNPLPVTPRKGTSVPPSPAKCLSTAVKRTLEEMVGARTQDHAKPGSTDKVSQSTIVKWLGKSPARIPKRNATPRKLIITPRKSVAKESDGVRLSHGVKRKLDCGDDADSSSNCTKEDRSNNPVPPVSKRLKPEDSKEDSSARASKPTPLSLKNCNHPQAGAKKALFGSGDISTTPLMFDTTPVKNQVDPPFLTYQSPTMNLPNYVMDPQPRAPQASVDLPPRTPDWLTSLRRNRKDPPDLEESPTACKSLIRQNVPRSPHLLQGKEEKLREAARTPPVSSRKRDGSSTPTTPKGTPRLRRCGSILKYFSPKN